MCYLHAALVGSEFRVSVYVRVRMYFLRPSLPPSHFLSSIGCRGAAAIVRCFWWFPTAQAKQVNRADGSHQQKTTPTERPSPPPLPSCLTAPSIFQPTSVPHRSICMCLCTDVWLVRPTSSLPRSLPPSLPRKPRLSPSLRPCPAFRWERSSLAVRCC